MDIYKRHRLLWRVFQPLTHLVTRAFRMTYEPIPAEGPILLIANHVTACDPLLIAAAMGRKQNIYFVASDHILRQGAAGRLIRWMVDPVPRRKGASSLLTVKECLRHLRTGRSVCIFAEGEQSWDGRGIPVAEGTGTLALAARAALVTYRLEGGYLSLPRWGKGLRRGRMRGRVTGVYRPEALATLNKEEINRLLNEGIRENAWDRQKEENVRFRGKRRAEHLEKCLYLCPGCSRVGTLKSEGNRLECACGLSLLFQENGFFDPPVPFSQLSQWEDWQRERLRNRDFEHTAKDGSLFSDAGVTLTKIDEENRPIEEYQEAELLQYEDRLECGGRAFPLAEIRDMAMTQASRLLFTAADGYYQVRSGGHENLRKYLEIWKEQNAEGRR